MAKSKKKAIKKVESPIDSVVEPVTVSKTNNDYFLEVQFNDKVFKTEAVNLTEALNNFVISPVFPFGSKTKVIIKFGKGKLVSQRLFQTPEARRLFATISRKPIAIEVLAEKLRHQLE